MTVLEDHLRRDLPGTPTERALSALAYAKSQARTVDSGRPRARTTLMLVLFAVVVLALFAAVSVGAFAYGNLVQGREDAAILRQGTGLVSNIVRAADAADAVCTGEGPEGPALVLVESVKSGVYETRIYAFEGQILEEYAPQDTPYTPSRATVVEQSGTLGFSFEGGLLFVQTDAGTSRVALRCAEGGAR